jgi:hypothetical protein
MKSFIPYSETSDFPIENLPYGVFSTAENVRLTALKNSHVKLVVVKCTYNQSDGPGFGMEATSVIKFSLTT